MLPNWLTEMLANPPVAGAGVHGLFSVARQLHPLMSPAGVTACITASVEACGRRVSQREIRDAVANSHEVQWVRGGVRPQQTRTVGTNGTSVARSNRTTDEAWPTYDPGRREGAMLGGQELGVVGLYDLWERSPIIQDGAQTASDYVDELFPGAEFLCLAKKDPQDAVTRKAEK